MFISLLFFDHFMMLNFLFVFFGISIVGMDLNLVYLKNSMEIVNTVFEYDIFSNILR